MTTYTEHELQREARLRALLADMHRGEDDAREPTLAGIAFDAMKGALALVALVVFGAAVLPLLEAFDE